VLNRAAAEVRVEDVGKLADQNPANGLVAIHSICRVLGIASRAEVQFRTDP
jgi:hypothetical protein